MYNSTSGNNNNNYPMKMERNIRNCEEKILYKCMNVEKLLYIPLHMETFRNSKAGAGTVVVESHIDCVQPTNDNAPCTYLHALNGKYQQNPVIYHENTEKRERHKNAFFRSIFVVVHDYCYCYCYVYDMLRSHHK